MAEEEKPMSIKERMAALAKASSGGTSVPTPAPPKSSSAPAGTSVAERLAKIRRDGPSPGVGAGGTGQSATGSPGPKKVALSRTLTPPSAPTVNTQSPGTPSGGSRVADRIAMMSGSASPSQSQSPFKGSTGSKSPGVSRTSSTSSQGISRTTSGGSDAGRRAFAPAPIQPRSDVMSVKSGSAGGSGEAASATSSPFATKSPRAPGKVSAGLTARMKGINLDPSAGGGEVAAAGGCGEEQEPPPPPAGGFSGTGSSPRVSQGLAARMQALGAGPGESLSREPSVGSGDAPGNGMGRAQRMGGVGLPGMGMGMGFPMPGAMPPGGIAELKRRKKEAERAASGGGGEVDSSASAVEPVAEQKPGELQHANLSRATMPQRRRPRKAARPFKATAAASPSPAVTDAAPPTASASPPPTPAPAAASPTKRKSPGKDTVTSVSVEATSSPAASDSAETGAVDTVAPSEAACALPDAGSARTMDAMLRAASARIEDDGDEDDAEWD
eukprot:jgi/Undpi1/5000/HiC_scaffold_19.g08352.m1